jgi:hypothetical protein
MLGKTREGKERGLSAAGGTGDDEHAPRAHLSAEIAVRAFFHISRELFHEQFAL